MKMASKQKLIKFVKSQNKPKALEDKAINLIERGILTEQWEVSGFLQDPSKFNGKIRAAEQNEIINEIEEEYNKRYEAHRKVMDGKCPKCGGKLKFQGDYYRCQWCGAYVAHDGSYMNDPNPYNIVQHNSTMGIFAVVIFIILVIILLIYFVLSYFIFHNFNLTIFAVVLFVLIVALVCTLNNLKHG